MTDLSGKIALITGAAKGQGAADALLFASMGAKVILTDVDDANGIAVQDKIVAQGGRALYRHLDVTSAQGWSQTIDVAKQEFGGLHILVNNAGIVPRATLEETSLEMWQRTIDVNLTGPMLGIKASVALIRESGGGSIINISSSAGLLAHYDASYSASKWGLRGLTKTASVEYAPWGIRVNSIHPGPIGGTGLSQSAGAGLWQSASAMIPMQRPGTPEECADLVLFLASDASRYITGVEIPIDGGYSSGATMWMRQQMKAKINAEAASVT